MKNRYFPCALIDHDTSYSIITSNFHFFDDLLKDKREIGGYTINTLAKKLVKENKIPNIKFDSEAGMFCAYSENKENLLELCVLFQALIGKEEDFIPKEEYDLKITVEKADNLLINGFVLKQDKHLQDEFYKNVPYPLLSNKQADYINKIRTGTDEEIIFAAKKINNEARTKTKSIKNYLAHPQTITYFIEAIHKTENNKVYLELIWAMAYICGRHLPDLRAETHFKNAISNKIATVRLMGLMGLGYIVNFDADSIPDLSEDRSEKVRKEYSSLKKHPYTELISWMFKT